MVTLTWWLRTRREDVVLDLTNNEELVRDGKGRSLGYSDHEMVKLRILRGEARQKLGLQP